MYIVKVLKRKDAASLIVAIILASSIGQSLWSPTYQISNLITGGPRYDHGPGWKELYLLPLVQLIIQLLIVEVALRIFIAVRGRLVRRTR